MDTLYNDMCDSLSCYSCDLTLIALFYSKNKLFLVLSTAKPKKKQKKHEKNNGKKTSEKKTFFLHLYEVCAIYVIMLLQCLILSRPPQNIGACTMTWPVVKSAMVITFPLLCFL